MVDEEGNTDAHARLELGILGAAIGNGVPANARFAFDDFEHDFGRKLDIEDFVFVRDDGNFAIRGKKRDDVAIGVFRKFDLLIGLAMNTKVSPES